VLTATDSTRSGAVVYEYDRADRVTKITQPGGQSVSYAYNTVGNRTLMTATVGANNYVTGYGYNNTNRLETVTANSASSTYTYDFAGMRTKLALPNNTESRYVYDALNRLESVKHYTTSTSVQFTSLPATPSATGN
jgi:YD repeat-containing protein